MQGENIIGLASRKSAEKNKKNEYYWFSTSTLFLLSDIVWFIVRRNKGYGTGWWEILILSISGVFFLFSALGVLFARSNSKFNKKIENEPLISFDTKKMVFLVESFIEYKVKELDKDSVESISINPESDEVTLHYIEKEKKKDLNIGYADYRLEHDINEQINQYKAY